MTDPTKNFLSPTQSIPCTNFSVRAVGEGWGEWERGRAIGENEYVGETVGERRDKVFHEVPYFTLPTDAMVCEGLSDVQNSDQAFNVISFVWSPLRVATLAFKVNCLSTEFAARKHGNHASSYYSNCIFFLCSTFVHENFL